MKSLREYDYGLRFDLGSNFGSGHFFRCMAIVDELIQNGFTVLLITNNETQLLIHLNSKKIPYYILKSSDEKIRINECKSICNNISNLIIDLPFFNELYSLRFKDTHNVIIIDDLGGKKIFSQFLFNGSIVKEFQNYNLDKFTKYFSGPKYLILRNQFQTIRDNVKVPKIKINKILLTFGGTDENNISESILSYFVDKSFKVSLLLGPSYQKSKKFNKLIEMNTSVKIFSNVENVAKLFANYDLIISSSGITSYEIASLGIPCIFIPASEFEFKTAIAMEKNGFGVNYGFWDNDFVRFDLIFKRMNNHLLRKKMYHLGRNLIDGKGVSRILQIIFSK